MKDWLMKKLSVYKKIHTIEYEILNGVSQMNISEADKDNITCIIKEAFDNQF